MGRLSPQHTVKNIGFAIGMMLFLSLSFKLTGELNEENTQSVLSQTDNVISTLNTPNTDNSLTTDK